MTVRVKPQIVAVAQFLHDEHLIPADFLIPYLERLNREHPGLSFADFLDGVRIIHLAARTGGRG